MDAHIRLATSAEARGLFRPVTCVVGGRVYCMYRSWRCEVEIPSLDLILRAQWRGNGQVYELPGGARVTVGSSSGPWAFDGIPVREVWPTTHRRELHCGELVYRVTPEDDTLVFDCLGEWPDPRAALVGIHLYLRRGDGGD